MEPLRVYHLQTNKVVSTDPISRESITESILVKLTGILSLKKYSLFLKQESTIPKNPPYIKRVLIDGKDAGEEEKRTAQEILTETLKPADKKLSYKQAFEEQEKLNVELGKRLAALEEPKTEAYNNGPEIVIPKAKRLFSDKELLQAKANDLQIKFRSNLGNEKLLLKIQDIEPEFEI